MHKKRYLLIALIITVTIVSACQSEQASPISDTNTNVTNNVTSSTDEPTSTQENDTEDPEDADDSFDSESPVAITANDTIIPEIALETYEIPDTEGMDFVQDMRIGWNLGNTFDATDATWLDDEMAYEAAWCGEYTTQEMFDDLKEAGFNSIRIPVTWHNHVDSDLTISEAWLNRVNEVVDYAIINDMYAIINIHHDFDTAFIYPTSEYYDTSSRYMSAIWTQLAEHFKDYDNKLIFESMNEPRMVGHNNEWWIDNNNSDCIDAIETINRLNQLFVDIVRDSGGNNSNRFLMVPGYDASSDGALHNLFLLPTDTAEDRLIVSVHAYTPYDFALRDPADSNSTDEFDTTYLGSTRQITNFMDALYNKFISQGIPVVIGEFGARDKNLNRQAKVNYATYYVAQAKARGMTCLWWDNNAFSGSGELFGLYNRSSNTMVYSDIVEGMMKYLD